MRRIDCSFTTERLPKMFASQPINCLATPYMRCSKPSVAVSLTRLHRHLLPIRTKRPLASMKLVALTTAARLSTLRTTANRDLAVRARRAYTCARRPAPRRATLRSRVATDFGALYHSECNVQCLESCLAESDLGASASSPRVG